jgi:5-methylcytosine-specific restriction endonuclease McrA
MGKKLPGTPRSRVRAALRALWLRSRERAAAIKREGGCCELCGAKQSVAKGREVKLEVHHLDGIDWTLILEYVYRHILVDPSRLEVLCKECHEKEHKD